MTPPCPICKGRGKALGYFNGRVLMAYCSCSAGKQKEKESDARCKALGLDVTLMRKYRVRLKDRTQY